VQEENCRAVAIAGPVESDDVVTGFDIGGTDSAHSAVPSGSPIARDRGFGSFPPSSARGPGADHGLVESQSTAAAEATIRFQPADRILARTGFDPQAAFAGHRRIGIKTLTPTARLGMLPTSTHRARLASVSLRAYLGKGRVMDQVRLEEETVEFVRDLIRFESVNTGDLATIGDGEARAARYVQDKLAEVGIESEYVESTPGRASLVARLPGSDPARGALVAHAHLDVVPVNADDWTYPPFAAEVHGDPLHGDLLYGRGAVDMKCFAGMLLAVARAFRREGVVPRRDLILAFFADEEAGGVWGARWLVEHRPELFAGATEAVSEVGGFSVPVDGTRRAYLLATAEKGIGRVILRAKGNAGHASRPTADNAVVRLARAVAALGEHRFPVQRTEATDTFLATFAELSGRDLTGDGDELERALGRLGFVGDITAAGLRNTATPTILTAGYKANVIPGDAYAEVDVRVLPGSEETFRPEVERLVGDGVTVEWSQWVAPIAAPADAPFVAVLRAAIASDDPDGVVVPYLLPASTDNKHLARLGIAGYGFVPLRVPDGFDAYGLFHAVDERVPLAALRFGARVTERILRTA
jgi:acetylornithine deacetylase/succinyl-diaminopimelate desuccinylase-like protein